MHAKTLIDKDLTVEKYYDKTRFDYRWVWNSRNTFAVHFGYYDAHATHHVAAVANLNRVLADWAEVKPNDSILDAGCGVGGSCLWLAQERGARVTGISIVESQLKDARANIEKHNLTHKIQFQKADYSKTPFPDASFEVIWAIESQCHADNKAAFYREAFRLLKNGGRLVMADYTRSARPLSIEAEKRLSDWLINWAIPDLDTVEEHKKIAETTGFQNFTTQLVDKNVERSLRNAYEHSVKWLPMAKFLNRLGIVSKTQVGNAFGTINQFEAWQSRDWSYTLF
ncbi:MAG: methyltransferase domain-containing protein [Saprospiraceae bacterium]|nr:methyltransferase domain-containing protein [Saprospiraceae bacterium]